MSAYSTSKKRLDGRFFVAAAAVTVYLLLAENRCWYAAAYETLAQMVA